MKSKNYLILVSDQVFNQYEQFLDFNITFMKSINAFSNACFIASLVSTVISFNKKYHIIVCKAERKERNKKRNQFHRLIHLLPNVVELLQVKMFEYKIIPHKTLKREFRFMSVNLQYQNKTPSFKLCR